MNRKSSDRSQLLIEELGKRRIRKPIRPSIELLEQRLMLSGNVPPEITVGRTLSSWTAADVQGGPLRITYSVYNPGAFAVSEVQLSAKLQPGVSLVTASQLPNLNGQDLAWSLGTLGPFEHASIEVSVSLSPATPLLVDAGSSVSGVLNNHTVTDVAPAASLRSGPVPSDLLASTPDANASDVFVQQKAAELDYDPNRIFEFLRDDIDYEAYIGSLRGARGTLWSGAGNALDEASLGIALLRASGVPARYVEGTVSDTVARKLIVSMFPEGDQTAGFVGPGTELADPANDSRLLAATRDHFWIEFDTGSGFQDIDTTFADAQVGQTFTSQSGVFSEVPDALRHKTTVRIDAEITNTATALFGIPGQSVQTVLEHTFNDVELVGRPISIGHTVSQSRVGAIVFSSTTTIYTPFISLGDVAFDSSRDETITGQSYQEVQTNFPFGSQILTGVFLKIELSGPDGPPETYERTLADRIGYAARQGGVQTPLAINPDGPPLLSPFDVFTLNVLPGRDNPAFPGVLLDEIKALRDELAQFSTGSSDPLPPEASDRLRLLGTLLSRLLNEGVSTASDATTARLASDLLVKAYFNRPRLTLTSYKLNIDPNAETASSAFAVDLRRDSILAFAAPGQDAGAAKAFNALRGVAESRIELETIQNLLGSSQPVPQAMSAPTVLEAALAQGIALTSLDRDRISLLDTMDISAEGKARISQAVANGRTVIVPTRRVAVGGESVIAWYEVDPNSGESIGVTEDGGHSGLLLFALATLAVAGLFYLANKDAIDNAVRGFFETAVANLLKDVAASSSASSLPPFLGDLQSKLLTRTTAEVAGLDALGPEFRPLLEQAIGTFLTDSSDSSRLANPVPLPPYPLNEASANLPFASTPGATGLSISNNGMTLTADQNTPTTFSFGLVTNLAGAYHINVDAPACWTVSINPDGVATILPAGGLQSGSYTIRLRAKSRIDPNVIAFGEITVNVTSTQPGITLSVEPDTSRTVPFGGIGLPTVYQALIHNSGPSAETFALTFPDIPAGFEILASATRLTIPPGQTGQVGISLRPIGSIPAPGTVVPFTVAVTGITDPSLSATEIEAFTVPEIHGVVLGSVPSVSNTTPGVATTLTLTLKASGNVPEIVDIATTLPSGLHADGLGGPIALAVGETKNVTITLTPDAGVALNSTLTATLLATFGPSLTRRLSLAVRVAVPGADAIADASLAARQIGNDALANRLDDLSIALTNLVQDPSSNVFKSQALANLDSVLSQIAADPILSVYLADLTVGRSALAAATTPSTIQEAVVVLGDAIDDFGAGVAALTAGNFELLIQPNSQVAQPLVPVQFQVQLHNIGTQITTYDLSLSGIPAGVTGVLSQTSITLDRDEFSTTVFVTVTPTSTTELAAFSFTVTASPAGAPRVARTAVGSLTARNEFVSVVSVTTDPPFIDPGGQVNVSARLLNAVNLQRQALASFIVRDASGQQVFASTPVPVELTVQTSLSTVALGMLDTTGFALGNDTIEVILTDTDGVPIPGATGRGTLLIGSPISANLAVAPDVLAPGTSTVTNTLNIQSQQAIPGALNLLGQASVAGASDVVRNGDFLYVSGSEGISVFNIAGANLNAPQLVGVVGSATNLLAVHGNLLVAVRYGQPTTKLDTYSLADPSNPQPLGTTGEIPYASATEIVVTDTHVFVAFVNLIFDSSSRAVLAQTGGVFAVNIENPAAPFFDGDAVDLKGTPAGRDGVDDGVLFNDNGTTNDGVGVFAPIDTSGGNQNAWDLVQVSPTTLLLVGSSSTGSQSQTGVGLVRVVDISDPRNLRLVRDVPIPGTVQAFGVAVDGDTVVVSATQGGWQNGSLTFSGNVVLATLDLSDPANPKLVHTEVQGDAARGIGFVYTVGSDLFAFGTGGPAGDKPKLYLLNADDPANPVFVGIDAPAGLQGISGGGNLVFTTDRNSLIVYQILASPGIPVTAQVQVPNNTGVAIVPGSFSVAPSQIISGADFDTLVFNLALTSDTPSRTITWQSTVSHLQSGESRAVSLGTTIDFVTQGTPGQIALPSEVVAAESILALDPATQTVRPGEAASYTLTVKNPTTTAATYNLSVQGVPSSWVVLASQVTVGANGSTSIPVMLKSGAFDALGEFGFTIVADTDTGITGSVGGSLVLAGLPLVPPADPEAHGVALTLIPAQAVAGQGTTANFVVRVVNTGSATETFTLSAMLPSGVGGEFGSISVVVPPGSSNFRDVMLNLTPQAGSNLGVLGFAVTASNGSVSGTTEGTLTVVANGVSVTLNPSDNTPGRGFQMTVTNTGSVTDTFDLALAGPGSSVASLDLSQVTLAPGASQVVPIRTSPVDFALPGVLGLTAVATSRGNTAVRDLASADLRIAATKGLDAGFDDAVRILPGPGPGTFVLIVRNTGNIADDYTAVITGTNGPVTARLIGSDGLPTQAISLFRLPGLTSGAIVLQTDLTALGRGTVTVNVQSLSDAAMTATSTATLTAGAVAVATETTLSATPNPVTPGQPVTFTALVTASGGGMPTGTVTFTIDGTPLPPVPLATFDGQARAILSITAPGVGGHTVTASYDGGPGFIASVSASVVLVVDLAPDVVGPTITSVQRFGIHLQPTRLVLTFNEDLDPVGAASLASYRLVGPGRDGRFGTRDDRVIRLHGATYNPATRSVTLRPSVRLPLRNRFRLTVLDRGKSGVADRSGNPLSGGAAVLPIRRANLVLPLSARAVDAMFISDSVIPLAPKRPRR